MNCLLILILSVVAVVTFAQEAIKTNNEVIEIKLRISGVAFTIQFVPGKDSAAIMSKKICTENADAINVDNDTVDNCIASVGQYIETYVNRYIQERTISVPITVSGLTMEVRFRPDVVTTDAMANQVCSEERIQAPLLAENKNVVNACVEPVSKYLRVAINNWITDKTLSIPLDVNGTKFDINYLPDIDSSFNIATKLCTQNANVIGGLTKENVIDVCITPVTNYLNSAADIWRSDKTLVLPLTVNDKVFTVSYMPEKETSLNVAKQLCISKAEDIGGLTKENVVETCINPVANYLQQAVQEWIDSKSLTVPIEINNKVFNLKYMPLRETSVSMAKKLCVENAEEIGGLTTENIIDECIKPVIGILESAAEKWVAEKKK